jgi:hypothetical protein
MSGPAEHSLSGFVARGAIVGAIAVVVAALITGMFGYAGQKGDIDAKMIELSVGILRSEPTPETKPLREWAIDVMEKRGTFKFSEEQRAALLKQELPFKPGAFSLTTTTSGQTLLQTPRQLQLAKGGGADCCPEGHPSFPVVTGLA